MTLPTDSKDSKIFLAIDANAIIHRAFHAYPPNLQTEDGLQVNAVYGFTTMLLNALENFHPEYVLCAMDTAKPTFRHEIYPDYKGTRPPTDQSLIDQMPMVEEVLNSFNIPIIKKEGYEADDILGTLSKYTSTGKWQDEDMDMYILSGDKDLLQLVREDVYVCLPNGSFKNIVVYDGKKVKEKYGYKPKQVVDYKAMVGDSSDNIPGIKGVGDVTATKLLEKYEDLDTIYKNIEDLSTRQKNLFTESIEQAEFSRKLATIETDMKLDIHLTDCVLKDFDRNKLIYTFKRYNFKSLLPKLDELFGKAEVNVNNNGSQLGMFNSNEKSKYSWSEYEDIKEEVKESDKIYIAYISKEESFDSTPFIVVGIDDKTYLIKEYLWIKDLESDIIFYNWEQYVSDTSLYNYDTSRIFGISLFEHLIKSEKRGFALKDISFDYSDYVLSEKISPGDYEKIHEVMQLAHQKQLEKAKELALYDFTRKSIKEYLKVQDNLLLNSLKQIELPISCILASMEDRGMKLDKEKFQTLKKEVDESVNKLEKEIYESVGHEFNINSPKQLADVLFNELQLPKSRKLSTKESVLRSMKGMHPIIKYLLEYREVSKISSTYIQPFINIINESDDESVHTDFKQTGTTSGRFSSVNPNMQNIPVSGKWASKVRECFVAREGFQFVAIDYSQMELRIMAHLSGDKTLIQDFIDDKDIHTATAFRILGKDIKEIDKKERSLGKTINFGMIFGQTGYGLSRLLDIEVEQSSKYINDYFQIYSGVEEYMKKTEKEAREKGYVQTMFGTTRNVAGMRSKNRRISSGASREAINMPIQGTEADIMKYAMIKLQDLIDKKYDRKVFMLIQIHDEILFEVEKSVVEKFKNDAKDIMTNAIKLDVPLKTHISIGNSWDELK
jgi:DNA polymerase-1